jgi:hypothetical protein
MHAGTMYKGLAMQARALFALVVTCLAAGAAAAGRVRPLPCVLPLPLPL